MRHLCFFALLAIPSISFGASQSSDVNLPEISSGEKVINILKGNYNSTVSNCGSEDKPAYLCSGVLFRGTNTSERYNAWDPSPASVRSGGVSFSYLRKDVNFNRLAFYYQNGFVLYNKMDIPSGWINSQDILCFFPIDGHTGDRNDAGCGEHFRYPDSSKPCQQQGIMDAKQWITKFNSTPADWDNLESQCGFKTNENGGVNSAKGFYQGILAASQLNNKELQQDNEVRISTWNTAGDGYPEKFPIAAFFYSPSSEKNYTLNKGIESARYDQASFYDKTQVWVPIIRLELPKDTASDTHFSYIPEEQRIIDSNIKVLEATSSGELTHDAYYRLESLSLSVLKYSGMQPGDKVKINWVADRHNFYSDSVIVKNIEDLNFNIPRSEIIDAIGTTVKINYSVENIENHKNQVSKTYNLKIEPQKLNLSQPVLDSSGKNLKIKYNKMNSHDRIRVRLEGKVRYDSSIIHGSDSGELIFNIPKEWINSNLGESVVITYAVGNDLGDQYNFSPALRTTFDK